MWSYFGGDVGLCVFVVVVLIDDQCIMRAMYGRVECFQVVNEYVIVIYGMLCVINGVVHGEVKKKIGIMRKMEGDKNQTVHYIRMRGYLLWYGGIGTVYECLNIPKS